MNYTNPKSDMNDSPEDWLNCALIFTRALSLMLEENTGIVVELKGEMKNIINPESDKVAVFYKDGMIHVEDMADSGLNEGDFIKIAEEN